MEFEFDKEEVFTQTLDLADPGNACIRGTTAEFDDYYLLIRTILGKTHIIKVGPIAPDLAILLPGFNVNYKKIDYKIQAISREINLFLNDAKKPIVEVTEVSYEDAFSAIPSLEDSFFSL